MAQHVLLNQLERPEPRGPGRSPGWLFFAVFGAPLAWFAQFLFDIAFASYPFIPNGTLFTTAPLSEGGDRIVLFVVNVVGLAIAALATWSAQLAWSGAGEGGQARGVTASLLVVRLTRTRYLAMWGLLNGAIFIPSIICDTVMLFGTPATC